MLNYSQTNSSLQHPLRLGNDLPHGDVLHALLVVLARPRVQAIRHLPPMHVDARRELADLALVDADVALAIGAEALRKVGAEQPYRGDALRRRHVHAAGVVADEQPAARDQAEQLLQINLPGQVNGAPLVLHLPDYLADETALRLGAYEEHLSLVLRDEVVGKLRDALQRPHPAWR